ncbi:MAG: DUF4131 domain-containing protein, partial [Candidatus Pacebacteria bacterium]|nr:DUF4131 domain-containing protein [Candidatus Paceibacterota bacterium]
MISKIFFWGCLTFILGITLGFLEGQGLWLFLLFGVALFSFLFIKEFYIKQKIKIISLLIIIFLMVCVGIGGWLNYNKVANPEVVSTDLSYFNDQPERVEIKGVVKRVEERIRNNRLIVEINEIKIGDEKKEVDGRVMAFVPRVVRVNYGDLIT